MIVSTNGGLDLFGPFESVVLRNGSLDCGTVQLPVSVIGTYDLLQLSCDGSASDYTHSEGVLTRKVYTNLGPVPKEVTRRQARQALLIRGYLASVLPLIAAIPDPVKRGLAEIEWEDSQVFERNRPLVIAIGTALGLDSAGLDELFIFASKL